MTKKEEYLELVRRCQYPMTKELAIMLRKEVVPFINTLEPKIKQIWDKVDSIIFMRNLNTRVIELYDKEEKEFIALALFLFSILYKKYKIKTDKEQGFVSVELNTTCDSCLNYKTCGIQALSICENFNTRFYEPPF